MVIIMEKFRNKFISFMIGRNGVDSLYKATIAVYVVMAVINLFARSTVLSVIMWALFFWSMFRCFSKNVYKRNRENTAYLQLREKLSKKLRMTKTMLIDKEHCYRKCTRCKTYLRLPRRSGEHTAVCPKCGEKISVKIR